MSHDLDEFKNIYCELNLETGKIRKYKDQRDSSINGFCTNRFAITNYSTSNSSFINFSSSVYANGCVLLSLNMKDAAHYAKYYTQTYGKKISYIIYHYYKYHFFTDPTV
uniref:Uncharacterized protein n=1 Tax=viral metagenome TaxID=1070528 RepID=A0A6C0CJD1_9ZZZZ